MSNPYRKIENGISFLDFAGFFGHPSGMILKNNGGSEKDYFDFIVEKCSYKNDANAIRLIGLNQKHTAKIIRAELVSNQPADGIFTENRGYAITIKTADCLPIFLSDGKTIALLHAGWRGLLAGIIDRFFFEAKWFDKDSAKALIGPHIGQCCFTVGPEVALLFNSGYLRKYSDRYFIDLGCFAIDALAANGIKYIQRYDACTACEPALYHSYRQEGVKTGQMIAYMSLG